MRTLVAALSLAAVPLAVVSLSGCDEDEKFTVGCEQYAERYENGDYSYIPSTCKCRNDPAPTPSYCEDWAPSSGGGDTGSGGDSGGGGDTGGDTGSPAETPGGGVGEWIACDLEKVTTAGTNFSSGFYGSGGYEECFCEIEIAAPDPLTNPVFHLRGDGTDLGAAPARVIIDALPSTSGFGSFSGVRDPFSDGDAHWQQYGNAAGNEHPGAPWDATGTYTHYLSIINGDNDESSCSSYATVEFAIYESGTPPTAPPAMPANPLGDEDGPACTGNAAKTSRFRLTRFARRWASAVPVLASGATRFAGADISTVTVTDWSGADSLTVIDAAGASHSLTPTAATLTLSTAQPLGTLIWRPTSSTATGAFGYPEVELSHTCPAAAPASTSRPVGYGLSRGELAAFQSAAAGATGAFPDLFVATGNTTFDAYVLRVSPVGNAQPGNPSHALTWEVAGFSARDHLLLTARSGATDTYDFSITEEVGGNTLVADGEVVLLSGGDLRITLTGGSWAGLALSTASLTLGPVATDTLSSN